MTEALTWMPAWRIRELIGKGDVSPVEVTEHFLGRIEELDGTLQDIRSTAKFRSLFGSDLARFTGLLVMIVFG